MPSYSEPSTPTQLVELAKQLDPQAKLRFLQAFLSTLDSLMLEAIKFEVEQALIQTKLRESVHDHSSQQPAKNIEFKKIKGKYYAYLRWREDGHHKSEYLGPMPFLPGFTYTLASKKDGKTKVFTLVNVEQENNQIYLKVHILKPINTIKSYSYPKCLDTVFNKKEWVIKQISSLSIASQDTPNDHSVNPKETTTPVQLLTPPQSEERGF